MLLTTSHMIDSFLYLVQHNNIFSISFFFIKHTFVTDFYLMGHTLTHTINQWKRLLPQWKWLLIILLHIIVITSGAITTWFGKADSLREYVICVKILTMKINLKQRVLIQIFVNGGILDLCTKNASLIPIRRKVLKKFLRNLISPRIIICFTSITESIELCSLYKIFLVLDNKENISKKQALFLPYIVLILPLLCPKRLKHFSWHLDFFDGYLVAFLAIDLSRQLENLLFNIVNLFMLY